MSEIVYNFCCDPDHLVDFDFGILVAERKADRSVRLLTRQAHSQKHVGRIERAAGTGAASRDRHAAKVEVEQERFAIHTAKAYIENATCAMINRGAVDTGICNVFG